MALGSRANELMLGERPDPGLFFQHDAESGRYEDMVFNAGWVGPSLRYRKLERLEKDPLFLAFLRNPFFRRLTTQVLGDGVALYRCVLWNKAPQRGMAVPWHQDDGRFWGLDQAPFLQVWTALDDASEQAGCLEVVPGSHHAGLATKEGGTVTPAALEAADAENTAVALPARRGESILVHNHTWHRTGRNRTDAPRRAISVSFLGAQVRCARRRRAPRQFQVLFES
jgi:phytanoyl-CoA hydroxylase